MNSCCAGWLVYAVRADSRASSAFWENQVRLLDVFIIPAAVMITAINGVESWGFDPFTKKGVVAGIILFGLAWIGIAATRLR